MAPASQEKPNSAPVLSCCRRTISSETELAGLRRQVDRLAAGHPVRAGGARERAGERRAHARVRMPRGRRDRLESERQQRIADQDRRRLVEGDVAGGLAAPEIVVVHRRQVVVDEGVGVHHLDGGGGVDRPRARHVEEVGAREDQEGAQPLAAGEERIAHRLVEAPVLAVGQGNQ